jgi:hypothetical protein
MFLKSGTYTHESGIVKYYDHYDHEAHNRVDSLQWQGIYAS